MIIKVVKYGVVAAVVVAVAGGLLFGGDFFSYLSSSARSLQTSVKDSVPMEFELQRARDLLEDIVPEMHANVRLIAQEEVEVENLQRDISRCQQSLADDEAGIRKLGDMLTGEARVYRIGGREYTRQAVKQDLSRRFERHKEARVVLEGKRRLLAAREKSLTAAIQMLDKARGQKALLADRIESLAAQHRLVKAASVGSKFQVENSKLAQTDKLIRQIKKRLDVAERVLAHEGQMIETIEIDTVDEGELLTQIGDYFQGAPGRQIAAEPQAVDPAGN